MAEQLILNPLSIQNNFDETQKKLEEKAKQYGIDKFININSWPILWKITMGVCALWAAWLSWKCSDYKGSELYRRIFSAIVAASFNVFYVIYYFTLKGDTCWLMKRIGEIHSKCAKLKK
jgi:hypothetical protein